jgi:transcription elongation factor GreB
MTPQSAKKLKEEIDDLWKVQRPRVTQSVAEAAAMGDRSENAEYIYGKKKLREIDFRIRRLKKRLENAVIVNTTPENRDIILFGAYVSLKDSQGRITQYRIVGPDDFDMMKNMITLHSPLGRALKGKKKGDEFTVDLPRGKTWYKILDVGYEEFK